MSVDVIMFILDQIEYFSSVSPTFFFLTYTNNQNLVFFFYSEYVTL